MGVEVEVEGCKDTRAEKSEIKGNPNHVDDEVDESPLSNIARPASGARGVSCLLLLMLLEVYASSICGCVCLKN